MIQGQNGIYPKKGLTLKVIRVARISTINQDERSLDDQLAYLQKQVQGLYDGPVDYSDLATQGSGEKLDREELRQLEAMVESGEFDLVICEDLARICRRARAVDICELCEDFETRLIAVNDRVDTADEAWRDGAFISTWHHERSNRDTSNRIKRSLRNRFTNGFILENPGPFYVVPDGALKVDEIQKAPGADDIVEQGFRMLEKGDNYSEVADWLNNIRFSVGGQSKATQWNGRLVKARFLSPRLKGIEEWNNKISVRENSSGRRKSKDAPDNLRLTRSCPHMAFVDERRFDALVTKLKDKGSKYSRKTNSDESDPLKNRPKKRTRFPGQSIYCGICGRKFVFGGHGQKDHLMCDGARGYLCWNGITVDGPLAAQKIAMSVLNAVSQLQGFDQAFQDSVNQEAVRADQSRQDELADLYSGRKALEGKIQNYLKFIGEGDFSATIRAELLKSETDLDLVQQRIEELETTPSNVVEIPDAEELKSLAFETLSELDPYTWEFNKIIQRLISRIVVSPYRLIDGGHIGLRGRFQLSLGQFFPDPRTRQLMKKALEQELTIDLFEPPQREAFRKSVVELRSSKDIKLTERFIAAHLGITVTAVQAAAALQRRLDSMGLFDAYQPVTAPPDDYPKLRRHKHKRYHFERLPDAGKF